ncbi:hypothetical protein HCN44_002422 [Aphidius gifuensis]|uniref:Ectonucleoside triphosphate diphosphohydrolase 5 n=1 Tax=Aphidius gifuensis TaxID=684658 RepID=A0A834Y164_APHGI|nr:ectonucleoside triphosphate diphosphohydrolase 5 isoform X2 [Aphidius gifuensis]KAF7996776.1 hypothetical protein HCN44_002422 [Aphidius gifuensis]
MQYTPIKTDDDWSSELATRQKKSQNQFGQKPIIIFIFLGILFLGYLIIASDLKTSNISGSIDSIATSFNLQKPFYAVVIDAGSTGSRVLAFTFHKSLINGELILDKELFNEIKPGLSNFADNPNDAIIGLNELINKAKNVIPKSEQSKTPLTMKATAGLRLLRIDKANNLLDECKKFFNTTGFLVNNSSVSIMDGVDEGIFAWFTVNFLFNHLTPDNTKNTVAVLDLGGGSTQVTYTPDNNDIDKFQKNHLHTIYALNNNMTIYTHSHLGMGLMASRKSILIDYNFVNVNDNDDGIIEVRSECINPIIKTQWSYAGKKYLVMGPINATHKLIKAHTYAGIDENVPVVKFDECVKVVKQHIDTIKERPIGLKKHDIYLVSYYFDRAAEAGLIHHSDGGIISLGDFHRATIDACNYPNVEQPFACLDMTFIYILLNDCFGLDSSTKLNLYKKYKGHELSWALGAAFNLLQNDF